MAQNKKNTKAKSTDSDPVPDDINGGKPVFVDTEPDGDIFADLFGDGTEKVIVRINRVEPEFYGGDNISGYLGQLSPGDDVESIRAKFGGGRFKIQKLVNNRYKRTGFIRISGLPRMPVPGENPERPIEDAPQPAQVPDGASYKGIPLSGSNAEFIAMIERIKVLDSIFPSKPDINDTLLKVALARGNDGDGLNSLLDQTEKLGRFVEQFGGGQQTGSNLIDLGIKAIDGLNKYVESAGAIQRNKMLKQIGDPSHSEAKSDLITEKPVEKKAIEMDPGQELSGKEIAEKAAGYIVTGYIQEPPQEPPDTVTVLRSVLPDFDQAGITQIVENKQILYLLSRNALASVVEIDAESGKNFDIYFQKVFDLFVGSADTTPNT